MLAQPVAVRTASVLTTGETLILDLDAVTVATSVTERIMPASRVDIKGTVGNSMKLAFAAGEIAAGRYFTLPAGAVKSIAGEPIVFRKIYAQANTATDVVEVIVYRG